MEGINAAGSKAPPLSGGGRAVWSRASAEYVKAAVAKAAAAVSGEISRASADLLKLVVIAVG